MTSFNGSTAAPRSSLTRRVAGTILAMILLIAPILTTQRAEATPGVDDYPYKNANTTCQVDGGSYPWCIGTKAFSEWLFFYRQCTDFVAWRLNNDNKVEFGNPYKQPSGQRWGNANTWKAAADRAGIRVDTTPSVGAVMWWDSNQGGAGSVGHVAWVKEVKSNDSVVIEEYNLGNTGKYSSSTVTRGSARWPASVRFLHIKDIPAHNPFGRLDSVSSPEAGVIAISGWAADPDQKNGPLTVHVYRGTKYLGPVKADKSRPDVAAAYPGYGSSLGYSERLSVDAAGELEICTYAINVGQGSVNSQLGCKKIQVADPKPFGRLDEVTGLAGQRAYVRGWVADPNLKQGPLIAHFYANDKYLGPLTANVSRPDVAAAYPGYGSNLGYSGTIDLPMDGTVKLCSYGINAGAGWANSQLGCKTVTVPHELSGTTPTISGSAQVGSKLTASTGTWRPSPVTLSYQWRRSGVAIPGANQSSYTVADADLGATITVTVTGSKSGYNSVSMTSAATAAVTGPPVAKELTATPVPEISGTAKVGKTLTAKPGTWKPAEVALAYQWYRNGTAIPDATASTYTLVAGDKGTTTTVKVTGSKTGYTAVTQTSKKTKKVAAGTLTTVKPKISGTAKIGETLTANPGTWKPAEAVLTYQWYRSGKKIKGATSSTYLLVSKDKGKKLTVKVTGKAPGYTTKSKTSKATKKIT